MCIPSYSVCLSWGCWVCVSVLQLLDLGIDELSKTEHGGPPGLQNPHGQGPTRGREQGEEMELEGARPLKTTPHPPDRSPPARGLADPSWSPSLGHLEQEWPMASGSAGVPSHLPIA